ncbi:MAG: GAF domain-containing protein [Pseudomonadota bacterium]
MPVPINDDDRLAALRSLDLLDAEPDVVVDQIVLSAAEAYDVPIALVSLVDESRQWFFSRVGLGAEETSRDIAFCAHTIMEEQHLLVSDTAHDSRFDRNPLVTGDLGIRFYAGVPLEVHAGLPIGTLCLIDQQPRHDIEDLAQLRAAADAIVDRFVDRLSIMEQNHLRQPHTVRSSIEFDGLTACIQVRSDLRSDGVVHWLQTMMSRIDANQIGEVVVDLHGCEFVDSSGMGALVQLMKTCGKSNIGFRVTNMLGTVRDALQRVRLAQVLERGIPAGG